MHWCSQESQLVLMLFSELTSIRVGISLVIFSIRNKLLVKSIK